VLKTDRSNKVFEITSKDFIMAKRNRKQEPLEDQEIEQAPPAGQIQDPDAQDQQGLNPDGIEQVDNAQNTQGQPGEQDEDEDDEDEDEEMDDEQDVDVEEVKVG
jgi:hypothetical protein